MFEYTTEEAMAIEAEREYADRFAPVATLADAHAHWHAVHGWNAVCDLDCGAGEVYDYEYEPGEDEGIRCGHCKARHWTVEEVKSCSERKRSGT